MGTQEVRKASIEYGGGRIVRTRYSSHCGRVRYGLIDGNCPNEYSFFQDSAYGCFSYIVLSVNDSVSKIPNTFVYTSSRTITARIYINIHVIANVPKINIIGSCS